MHQSSGKTAVLSLLLEKQREPAEGTWSSLVLGMEPQNTYVGVLQCCSWRRLHLCVWVKAIVWDRGKNQLLHLISSMRNGNKRSSLCWQRCGVLHTFVLISHAASKLQQGWLTLERSIFVKILGFFFMPCEAFWGLWLCCLDQTLFFAHKKSCAAPEGLAWMLSARSACLLVWSLHQ